MARTFIKEKDVKAAVKDLLKKDGWFYWMPAANGFGVTGVSDILAIRKGVFLAIETKFGGNKPTAMQVAFLNSINAENAFGFVVDEKRIGTLSQWLAAFNRASIATSNKQAVAPEDGAALLDCIRVMTEELA